MTRTYTDEQVGKIREALWNALNAVPEADQLTAALYILNAPEAEGCKACHGKGYFDAPSTYKHGELMSAGRHPCDTCHGTGKQAPATDGQGCAACGQKWDAEIHDRGHAYQPPHSKPKGATPC